MRDFLKYSFLYSFFCCPILPPCQAIWDPNLPPCQAIWVFPICLT